jgi:phosphoserine phosphatase
MNYVVTLTSDPTAAKLTTDIVNAAHDALEQAGAEAAEPDWLAPEIACDIAFNSERLEAAVNALPKALSAAPVDHAVQPIAGRRKKLLVADMESTIIENEMVDELGELLGIGPKVADITRRAMNGDIPFRTALAERIALLGGLEEEMLKRMRGNIRVMPGAEELVGTMRANGAYTTLVSGGLQVYSKWVKRRLGFHKHIANDLVLEDGIVTGKLNEPILGREGKLQAMDKFLKRKGWDRSEAIAVGDGANDLDMLAAAGTGVAFRAKPSVAAAADIHVGHGDLTALLYIQGYRLSEFQQKN